MSHNRYMCIKTNLLCSQYLEAEEHHPIILYPLLWYTATSGTFSSVNVPRRVSKKRSGWAGISRTPRRSQIPSIPKYQVSTSSIPLSFEELEAFLEEWPKIPLHSACNLLDSNPRTETSERKRLSLLLTDSYQVMKKIHSKVCLQVEFVGYS